MTDEPPRKVTRTLDVLIDGKPLTFDHPEGLAFDLDEDPLIEFGGERHELPAGVVLVWTGRELHWYPASHPVRLAVKGAGMAPRELLEGGTVLWEEWPDPGFLMGFCSYNVLDDAQCMRAYLLAWWRAFLERCPDTVGRATEAAANPGLYEVQRAAAAQFLAELTAYRGSNRKPRGHNR